MGPELGEYDVIVAGAGIVGASVAYHLVRRGMQRVLLLDSQGIGSGATGRSGGIARTHLPHPGLVALAEAGRRAYSRFFTDLGEPVGYETNGALFLASPAQARTAEAVAVSQREAGSAASVVSPEEVGRLVPGIDLSGVATAVHEPEAGHGDAYRVATAYVEAARGLGLTVRIGLAVTGILVEGGQVAGVITPKGEARAPVVVNAAGAWGGRLAALAGLELPVRPVLRRVALLVPADGYGPGQPSVYDLDGLTYWRPEGMQMVMVGGGQREVDEVLHGQADLDDPPAWADETFVAAALDGFVRRMPAQEGAGVGGSWAGVDGTTPDFLPLLGASPELPGLVHACGMSGHGFKLAPAVGQALAELITTGACVSFDLTPFSPARFSLAGRGSSTQEAPPPAYGAAILP